MVTARLLDMSTASSVPISAERPWGHRDSPGTNKENLEIGLYVCHMCNKHYSRHCDLNKHVKMHNRSFKCPVQGCRYNTFGWPTEKELERHHNDKHSAAPRVFSCWYQPCTYTSKRESNCKQHMEKAHGWRYIRSRPGQREEASDPTGLAPHDGDTIFVSNRPAVDLNLHTVPHLLLTPSPLGQRLPTPHDGPLSMDLSGTVQYVPGVYGPWTSPLTPLGNHGSFVEAMGQAYIPDSPGPARDDELLKIPLDPRLRQNVQDASPTNATLRDPPLATGREELLKTLPTIVTAKSSPVVKSQVLTPTTDMSPATFPAAVAYRGVVVSGNAESGPTTGISSAQHFNTRSTSLRKTDGKRQVSIPNESDDDSDDDEEPPTKRNKGPEGGGYDKLGDPKMICPFRAEHPDIYNRELDPKYASCHTEHMNISTVVRHLGRPAHTLKVDNSRSTISSFDIVDPEYDHPAAALCRTCWTQFDSQKAFEEHAKANCVSRSRGKREKFDLIRDTFCRLRTATVTEKGSSEKGKAREGEGVHTAADAQAHRLDTVSRHEFVGLVKRVTELERILATRMPRATPRVVPQQAQTVARAFSSSPALPSSQAAPPFGFYAYDDSADSSRAVSGNNFAQQSLGSLGQSAVERGNRSGQYNENQNNMASLGSNAPSRPDSASRFRQENTPAMTRRASQQLQRPGENNNPRRVGISAYGPASTAAMVSGDSQGHVGSTVNNVLQLARNQGGDFGPGQTSQESTNTTMRNQWDHAVQVGDEMLGIFSSAGEDLSKYLDMGSN